MSERYYPMSPIVSWADYHGIAFDTPLIKRVEKYGREVAAACGMRIA